MEDISLSNKYKIRVRYADTDQMGVVHNSKYLVYFEVARTELMRSYGMVYRELEEAGYQLPLLESQVKYIQAALYDDELEIEATMNYTHSPKIRIEYNILRSDTTIAKGYTLHSFIKKENRRPVKPPKIFVDLIKRAAKR